MLTMEEKRARAAEAVAILEERYPDAECALHYGGDPWRLLVMARLSAQCKDERVNIVCEDLFAHYPDARAMAEAPLSHIEALIRPCGLHVSKAKSIKAFSEILVNAYEGRVPDTMDELLALPGVGRKIANLILGDIYGIPGIVADTHCIRISGRMGLVESDVPEKVEKALVQIVSPEKQTDFCHRLVMFGREVCDAKKPRCEICPFSAWNCILKKEK